MFSTNARVESHVYTKCEPEMCLNFEAFQIILTSRIETKWFTGHVMCMCVYIPKNIKYQHLKSHNDYLLTVSFSKASCFSYATPLSFRSLLFWFGSSVFLGFYVVLRDEDMIQFKQVLS